MYHSNNEETITSFNTQFTDSLSTYSGPQTILTMEFSVLDFSFEDFLELKRQKEILFNGLFFYQ